MGFTHYAIYGMTGQGKSTIMKRMLQRCLGMKRPALIFNPTGESWPTGAWPAGVKQVANADALEAALMNIRRTRIWTWLFLDEARFLRMQQRNHHESIINLGTMGRHYPVTIFVASQFPTGVDTALRWNCGKCFCFRLANEEAAKEVWKVYNQQSINGRPVWEVILALKPFECVYLTPESATIMNVKPPSGGKSGGGLVGKNVGKTAGRGQKQRG